MEKPPTSSSSSTIFCKAENIDNLIAYSVSFNSTYKYNEDEELLTLQSFHAL